MTLQFSSVRKYPSLEIINAKAWTEKKLSCFPPLQECVWQS